MRKDYGSVSELSEFMAGWLWCFKTHDKEQMSWRKDNREKLIGLWQPGSKEGVQEEKGQLGAPRGLSLNDLISLAKPCLLRIPLSQSGGGGTCL